MPVNSESTVPNSDQARHHAVMQGTVVSVSPRAKELVAHFYGRLFGRAPELEQQFAQVTVQQQHAKLWAIVNLMANTESDGRKYRERFSALQVDHAERDLRPEQYHVFGEVLVDSLRYFEGARWTAEKQEVWTAAISDAARMISSDAHGDSTAA